MLDYSYFKENYKIIAIDLSKQQVLDADPRTIQQINFMVNLAGNITMLGSITMLFIIEEAKETIFEFWQGNVKFCKCNSIET